MQASQKTAQCRIGLFQDGNRPTNHIQGAKPTRGSLPDRPRKALSQAKPCLSMANRLCSFQFKIKNQTAQSLQNQRPRCWPSTLLCKGTNLDFGKRSALFDEELQWPSVLPPCCLHPEAPQPKKPPIACLISIGAPLWGINGTRILSQAALFLVILTHSRTPMANLGDLLLWPMAGRTVQKEVSCKMDPVLVQPWRKPAETSAYPMAWNMSQKSDSPLDGQERRALG